MRIRVTVKKPKKPRDVMLFTCPQAPLCMMSLLDPIHN